LVLVVTEKISPPCIWGSARADPAIRVRRMAKETRTILTNAWKCGKWGKVEKEEGKRKIKSIWFRAVE
jgi:hypothetical protein